MAPKMKSLNSLQGVEEALAPPPPSVRPLSAAAWASTQPSLFALAPKPSSQICPHPHEPVPPGPATIARLQGQEFGPGAGASTTSLNAPLLPVRPSSAAASIPSQPLSTSTPSLSPRQPPVRAPQTSTSTPVPPSLPRQPPSAPFSPHQQQPETLSASQLSLQQQPQPPLATSRPSLQQQHNLAANPAQCQQRARSQRTQSFSRVGNFEQLFIDLTMSSSDDDNGSGASSLARTPMSAVSNAQPGSEPGVTLHVASKTLPSHSRSVVPLPASNVQFSSTASTCPQAARSTLPNGASKPAPGECMTQLSSSQPARHTASAHLVMQRVRGAQHGNADTMLAQPGQGALQGGAAGDLVGCALGAQQGNGVTSGSAQLVQRGAQGADAAPDATAARLQLCGAGSNLSMLILRKRQQHGELLVDLGKSLNQQPGQASLAPALVKGSTLSAFGAEGLQASTTPLVTEPARAGHVPHQPLPMPTMNVPSRAAPSFCDISLPAVLQPGLPSQSVGPHSREQPQGMPAAKSAVQEATSIAPDHLLKVQEQQVLHHHCQHQALALQAQQAHLAGLRERHSDASALRAESIERLEADRHAASVHKRSRLSASLQQRLEELRQGQQSARQQQRQFEHKDQEIRHTQQQNEGQLRRAEAERQLQQQQHLKEQRYLAEDERQRQQMEQQQQQQAKAKQQQQKCQREVERQLQHQQQLKEKRHGAEEERQRQQKEQQQQQQQQQQKEQQQQQQQQRQWQQQQQVKKQRREAEDDQQRQQKEQQQQQQQLMGKRHEAEEERQRQQEKQQQQQEEQEQLQCEAERQMQQQQQLMQKECEAVEEWQQQQLKEKEREAEEERQRQHKEQQQGQQQLQQQQQEEQQQRQYEAERQMQQQQQLLQKECEAVEKRQQQQKEQQQQLQHKAERQMRQQQQLMQKECEAVEERQQQQKEQQQHRQYEAERQMQQQQQLLQKECEAVEERQQQQQQQEAEQKWQQGGQHQQQVVKQQRHQQQLAQSVPLLPLEAKEKLLGLLQDLVLGKPLLPFGHQQQQQQEGQDMGITVVARLAAALQATEAQVEMQLKMLSQREGHYQAMPTVQFMPYCMTAHRILSGEADSMEQRVSCEGEDGGLEHPRAVSNDGSNSQSSASILDRTIPVTSSSKTHTAQSAQAACTADVPPCSQRRTDVLRGLFVNLCNGTVEQQRVAETASGNLDAATSDLPAVCEESLLQRLHCSGCAGGSVPGADNSADNESSACLSKRAAVNADGAHSSAGLPCKRPAADNPAGLFKKAAISTCGAAASCRGPSNKAAINDGGDSDSSAGPSYKRVRANGSACSPFKEVKHNTSLPLSLPHAAQAGAHVAPTQPHITAANSLVGSLPTAPVGPPDNAAATVQPVLDADIPRLAPVRKRPLPPGWKSLFDHLMDPVTALQCNKVVADFTCTLQANHQGVLQKPYVEARALKPKDVYTKGRKGKGKKKTDTIHFSLVQMNSSDLVKEDAEKLVKQLDNRLLECVAGCLGIREEEVTMQQMVDNLPASFAVNSSKLEPYKVGIEDERTALHGSWGLRTKSDLEPFTILAPYAGLQMLEMHFKQSGNPAWERRCYVHTLHAMVQLLQLLTTGKAADAKQWAQLAGELQVLAPEEVIVELEPILQQLLTTPWPPLHELALQAQTQLQDALQASMQQFYPIPEELASLDDINNDRLDIIGALQKVDSDRYGADIPSSHHGLHKKCPEDCRETDGVILKGSWPFNNCMSLMNDPALQVMPYMSNNNACNSNLLPISVAGWSFLWGVTIKGVKAGDVLWYSYGSEYWEWVRESTHNYQRHDALLKKYIKAELKAIKLEQPEAI